MKSNKVDHPLYIISGDFFLNDLAEAMKALDGKKYIISGDFNQADVAFPDVWNDLWIYAKVTDTQPNLLTFEGPMVTHHSIEYYAPLNI